MHRRPRQKIAHCSKTAASVEGRDGIAVRVIRLNELVTRGLRHMADTSLDQPLSEVVRHDNRCVRAIFNTGFAMPCCVSENQKGVRSSKTGSIKAGEFNRSGRR
jgi:hypothetical protein